MNSIAILLIGLVSQVAINQNWVAQRGPGPYYLTQAGATYVLQTDIATPGTAFVVAAPNVTLDLNGHTVTYDHSQPLNVPNGGFEQGTSPTDIPGWDVSRAPGALRLPARTGMWGHWMLHLPDITARKSVVSGPIDIPLAGVEYAALITPKSSYLPTVTLSVVDAVTGTMLGKNESKDPDRGFSPVVKFTPATTSPVRLVVDVAPSGSNAKTATVDLDYAAIYRTGSHGVIATPSPWTLPPHLRTPALEKNAGRVVNAQIRGGSIVQGHGESYGASAIYAMSIAGIIIDRVEAAASGADTNIFNLTYAESPTVRNCRLIGRVDRFSDRMLLFAAIQVANTKGPVRIEDNTIFGTMHTGILMIRPSTTITEPVRIHGNTIEHEAIVTDGYGIVLCNVRNFQITRNAIRPINGRGILLDTFSGGSMEGGRIDDNIVEAREGPNLEYQAEALEAVALTVRVFKSGAVRKTTFTNNTFSARTGRGGDWAAAAVRVAISEENPQMRGADLVFRGNTFQALIDSLDPASSGGPRSTTAWAVTLACVPAGTGLRFIDNVFASNNVSLNFGDDTGYRATVTDVLFQGSTIRKLGEGAAVSYHGVVVGDWQNTTTGVRLISTRYADGADPAITFLGTSPKDIEVGRLLNLTVTNPDGTAAAGAEVRIVDREDQEVYRDATDGQGRLVGIPIVSAIHRQTGPKPSEVEVRKRGPFTVRVSAGSRRESLGIDELTRDLDVTIRLP
jgi:hypothetical protein